ncbi:MAG TPA: NTP transferase domain-containing protein [Sphingomicrobium sp.]|nr:NTP transferase domain-containing protein [Sphingomicrobium sp.]
MCYTAIVLAGSRPGRDDLAEQFGTDLKALIPLAGEPMVRRPVQTLLDCEQVAQVLVLSQHPDRIAAALPEDSRLSVSRSESSIAETLLSLIESGKAEWPLLVTTADHALLDPAMVRQFCADAEGAAVVIGVVERDVLLKRFPTAQRTWIKFRGGRYTGANLFALRSPPSADAIRLWSSIEQSRKKGWRVVSLLGPVALVGAALRLVSLDQLLARVGRRLGLNIRAVRMADPLAGIDVDKPSDHALVEKIIAGEA